MFTAFRMSNKVAAMPSLDRRRLEGHNRQMDPIRENLVWDEDLLMEQILENVNNTPMGQVLKKIAMLPEVRRDKVLDVRRQITEGSYNLGERLEVVIDKVLEDLTA